MYVKVALASHPLLWMRWAVYTPAPASLRSVVPEGKSQDTMNASLKRSNPISPVVPSTDFEERRKMILLEEEEFEFL